jgi:hypothetical protein
VLSGGQGVHALGAGVRMAAYCTACIGPDRPFSKSRE